MYQSSRRVRIVAYVALLAAIIFPLTLYIVRSPKVMTLLPVLMRTQSSRISRYSVRSDVKGYTLSLVSPDYLDYTTASLNIFTPNAVADPQMYHGQKGAVKRTQISHIKFVLVEEVDDPITAIVEGDGQKIEMVVVSTGDYDIQDDTLVVRVAVQFSKFSLLMLTSKFGWEEAFLRCAINTMYYALGTADPVADQEKLVHIKKDMEKNVYSGLFVWPFRITEKKI
jgi:hypothetical protein